MSTTRRTGTTTTTTQTTARDLRTALTKADLPPSEEHFMRMRFGITEPASSKLQYRGQTHEESRIKLAMIERDLLDEIRGANHPTDDYAARKERIIRKLREL
ncbi:MAG: hypothetical protein HUU55_09790 [Myxococcales bacterium]|nr:hypothetical protein [Myxococcales bacterium]